MTLAATMNATQNETDDFGLTAEEQQFANAAPGVPMPGQSQQPAQDFGQKLREQTIAVRLQRSKLGISRKLNHQQLEQAAQQFDAQTDRLTAGKKIIDRKTEKYRKCLSTINAAVAYWRDVTVPYPEDGIRLMRRDRVAAFEQHLNALKAELQDDVVNLKLAYSEIIEKSREDLGVLFNPSDYPDAEALTGLFDLQWDYPSQQPDAYLMQLNPALYEAEQRRIQARFDEAVKLAEEAFTAEFAKLVGNLADRLQFGEDGKPKVFKDSSISGMTEFFARFKELNVGSSAELEQLVNQAQQLVQGDAEALAKDLRKDVTKRQTLQQAMQELAGKIEEQLVNKPLRAVSLDE